MGRPLVPSQARRTETASSRPTMIAVAHSGNRPRAVSVTIGAEIRSLSASGSSHCPVRVAAS